MTSIITITSTLEQAINKSNADFARECMKSLALKYGLDEDEALKTVGLYIALKKSTTLSSVKKQSLQAEVVELYDQCVQIGVSYSFELELDEEKKLLIPTKIGKLTKLVKDLKQTIKKHNTDIEKQVALTHKNTVVQEKLDAKKLSAQSRASDALAKAKLAYENAIVKQQLVL
jgi:hypothetical protein